MIAADCKVSVAVAGSYSLDAFLVTSRTLINRFSSLVVQSESGKLFLRKMCSPTIFLYLLF